MRLPWIVRLPLLLALAVIFYLGLRAIDVGRFARALETAQPAYVAAMLAAWSAMLFLRPLRMLLLLRAVSPVVPGDYRSIWLAHVIGMAVNSIVPLRSGDVVMALLFRQWLRISMPQALSILMVDRICDTAAVATVFLASLAAVPVQTAWAHGLALALMAGLILGVAALGLAVRLREPFLAWLARRLRRLKRSERWLALARDLLSGFATISTFRRASLIVAITVGLWGSTVLSYWLGIRAVIAGVSAAAAGFAVGAVGLSFIVPLAPGGIGVFHAAVLFALEAFGVPAEPALAFAIIAHAAQLLSVLALGAAASVAVGFDLRTALRRGT